MTALFVSATMMMAAEKKLTFDLTSNPGNWPTSNSTTPTDYTYTLNDVDYTFVLKNVKCNSGYTMFTQPAALGLPVIEGYKLTKVVVKNTSGCSTSVEVGIISSATEADYVSGGEAQKWANQGTSYTYVLSETAKNKVYYIYATKKNAQITEVELTYSNGTPTKHDYTINAYLPEFPEEIEAYEDRVRVMGSFDNWTDGVPMTKTFDEGFTIFWTARLNDVAEGTEFKLRFGSNWDVQVLKDGEALANEKTGTEETITLRYDGEGYSFTGYPGKDGPKVDKTGITVNGRKYGFPVRMVTE